MVSRRAFVGTLAAAWVPLVVRGAEPIVLPARGLCAHRGGGAAYPENTLPALREAVRLGAQMIEFDLATTRDGELVLMHDTTVNRTTDGKGRVIDFTLTELQRLDAGAWMGARFAGTRVPTFAEALAVLPRNVWINVDFKADARFAGKSGDVARRVAERIAAEGRLHQTLFAARGEDAVIARQTAPGLLICCMDRKPDPEEYVRAAIAQRADFIQLRDCARDARLPGWIATLHAARVRVNYFEGKMKDEPAEAARLLGLGVNFVLVDDVAPALARQPGLLPVRPLWR